MRTGRHRGYTYLVMLFAVALSGATLAMASVVWHHEARRAKERELLLVGEEFRRAIGLYYERTPGAAKRYPEKLDDLLKDHRYLTLQRYLRRLYRDPVTGQAQWGLVTAPDKGIQGVYSLSRDRPIKQQGFPPPFARFEGAASYADWKFVYIPASPPTTTPPPSTPAQRPAPPRS